MFMPTHAPIPNTSASTRAATPMPFAAFQNSSHLFCSLVVMLEELPRFPKLYPPGFAFGPADTVVANEPTALLAVSAEFPAGSEELGRGGAKLGRNVGCAGPELDSGPAGGRGVAGDAGVGFVGIACINPQGVLYKM